MQPGPGQQLTKFACLDCHRVFKRPVEDLGKRNMARPIEIRRCPACGGGAYLMSSDFRAPPKEDRKAWEVVAFLARQGFAYFRAFEERPLDDFAPADQRPKGMVGYSVAIGPYPETMAEAQVFVDRYRHMAQPIVDQR